MALFSRSKGVVGLDIGSYAVKLVEVNERKGQYTLRNLGLESLSPEAIVDGSIMDSSLVVEAINRLGEATQVRTPQDSARTPQVALPRSDEPVRLEVPDLHSDVSDERTSQGSHPRGFQYH